mgnify:CR=1 FL=1
MALARHPVRVVQLAATVGCFVLLWRLADGAAALRHLAAANGFWVGAAFAALTLQTLLSALRWRLTAAQLGIALDRRTAVSEYYLAQLVNQLVPGGVLGDAGRALRARVQAGLLASGQAVLFERLAGQLALLLVFGAGVASTMAVPGGFDWPGRGLPLVLLAGAGGALVLCCSVGRLPGRPGRVLANFGAGFLHAVAAPEVRARQVAMSLGTALCNIAAFACCAAAIGVSLSPAAAPVLVPLILFTMLVPVTVSGWGLREGAAASLLPLAGASAAEGLAASVVFGLAVVASALPGLVALTRAATPGPARRAR